MPVYVNQWSDPDNPALTILTALEKTLATLAENPISALKDIAKTEVKKIEVGSSIFGKMALEFTDKNAKAATGSDLIQIGEVLARLAVECGDKAILIIDEIQHLATSNKFDVMFSDKDKAFFNSAFMIDFPRLDHTFVRHCRDTLQQYFELDYDVDQLFNDKPRQPCRRYGIH